ncbi:MAG TPA: hypothetical protein VFW96_26930 [Thermomicrobiales bacterium]|nr:hypothetical protein [Thermomicrobiales bacterium]
MRLFEGLAHTNYQDVLRAVGRELDARDCRQCVVAEVEDGLVVEVRAGEEPDDIVEMLQFGDEELADLLAEVHQRREGHAPERSRHARLAALQPPDLFGRRGLAPRLADARLGGYQDTLRTIGRFMDSKGFREFRLIEQEDGFLLQPRRTNSLLRRVEVFRLSSQDLLVMRRNSAQLRGIGHAGSGPLDAAGPPT